MIGRFQSNNRIKIKVIENLINSWTHLKDGLSGSEDIRLKACSILGLCDMDKKYISRFFDFFFDFDFNHDFDKQTCFISHLTCFCTSYLFLHILLVLHILFCTFLYSITHFTLYLFFTYIYIYIYIYMLLCGVTFI